MNFSMNENVNFLNVAHSLKTKETIEINIY